MPKLKPFVMEYRHGGKTYHANFWATDHADCKARALACGFNGEPMQRVFGVEV